MTSRFAASILSLLVLYFAYHAFAGEQGLGSWTDTQIELADKQKELKALEAKNTLLRNDIARLKPGSVDPDYVEALARDKLAFVYPDEVVLIGTEPISAN